MIRYLSISFCSLIIAALFSSAALSQAPVADPIIKQGTTVKIGKYTYAIPDNNVGGVPNVGIVVGEKATLVIDPGMGKRNGEIVLQEVAKISNNKQLYIASTHFHPEHTTGYLAFPDSAKYINSVTQEKEMAESGQQSFSFFVNRSPVFKELLEGAHARKADITFDKEYELDLGGVTVKMMLVGPTHTKGDTGFFVVEDKVLFSGDVVMKDTFLAALQDASTEAWLAAFDTFEALKPEIIVPAHGPFGDSNTIAENRAWFMQLLQQAYGLKSEHIPVETAVQMITSGLTQQHPNWGRSFGIENLVKSVYAQE